MSRCMFVILYITLYHLSVLIQILSKCKTVCPIGRGRRRGRGEGCGGNLCVPGVGMGSGVVVIQCLCLVSVLLMFKSIKS